MIAQQQQQAIGALLNGRYRILRVLGRGGVGTVYLAEHTQLEMRVALKEVPGQALNDPETRDALEQCRREGRLLVHLDHPNLPKVTDAFIEGDRFYLVREYVEGVTAEDRLRAPAAQPLDVQQVVEWGIQIATVLIYLHSQAPPIIFRDLKPDNIIVQPDGTVKLVDFGIARRFSVGASNDTVRLGSLGFSPPEQFGLQQTDQRSDLYSLGATLHHLLTGYDPSRQPFRLPAAVKLNPEIPVALSDLIDRCLSLDPGLRPVDAEEVLDTLVSIHDSGVALTGMVSLQPGRLLLVGGDQAIAFNREPPLKALDQQEALGQQEALDQQEALSQQEALDQPSHRLTSHRFLGVLMGGVVGVLILSLIAYSFLWFVVGKGNRAINAAGASPAQAGNSVAKSASRPRSLQPPVQRARQPVRATLSLSHPGGEPLAPRSANIRAVRHVRSTIHRKKLTETDSISARRSSAPPIAMASHRSKSRPPHTTRASQPARNSAGGLPNNQLHDTDLESVLGAK